MGKNRLERSPCELLKTTTNTAYQGGPTHKDVTSTKQQNFKPFADCLRLKAHRFLNICVVFELGFRNSGRYMVEHAKVCIKTWK